MSTPPAEPDAGAGAGAGPPEPAVTFTRAGLRKGFVDCVPFGISGILFGLALGIGARGLGWSALEVAIAAVIVFSGPAQLAVLTVWTSPVSIAPVVLTTIFVNLRHVLMGASLRPWFARLRSRKVFLALFFMTESTYALSIRERAEGRLDVAYMVGGGLALMLFWAPACVAGHMLAEVVPEPRRLAFDFVLAGLFSSILAGELKRRGLPRLALPWAVAAGASLLVWAVVPGPWFVMVGGLAGAIAGAMRG
ncbi:MAG: AzlC family ABC transporter permease [Alphaproteobacteria bacterium]|nr:AzlC family ABC transporter permease [Alphaproteobacteria bacterium]